MLRQPLETGKVTISRAASTVTYPAEFQMVGAMNPCPCGYIGSRHYYCTCTPKQIAKYQNRISGPIEDRMDMLLKLDTVILENESETENETSEEICTRVIKARERQYERYQANFTNANVENEKLMPSIQLSSNQQEMMRQWTSENNWSTRVQMKVLRLARTISDLSGAEELTNEAIWEAVNLRRSQVNPQRKGAAR